MQEVGVRKAFRTAVVPAAGMGTRFLPATKTVPKELLPVVDTPGIELVATEAAHSGAQRLLIVTAPGKDGVVAHFVDDFDLEEHLEAKGKLKLLEKVRRAPTCSRSNRLSKRSHSAWAMLSVAQKPLWSRTKTRSPFFSRTISCNRAASWKRWLASAPSAEEACCAPSTFRRAR